MSEPQSHPTAVIEPGAVVGPGCRIGAYAVVGAQVRLGPDTLVGPHVVIEGRTTIGPRNRILQFASVGAGPQADGWTGEAAALTLGADNVIREGVTLHGALGAEPTRIGDRNLIMAGAHVGHDCVVGSDVRMANAATLGGHVVVEDGAQISGLVAVHQHVRVGRLSFIAGGAMVVQDVPPFCTVQGDRARLAGLNLVGLRRAGLTPQALAGLRRAYRLLFLGVAPMAERLAAVRALDLGPEAERLADSLGASGRGAISTPRRAAA